MSDTDARILLMESLANNDDPEVVKEFQRVVAKAHPRAKANMPHLIVEDAKAAAQEIVDKARAEYIKERNDERVSSNAQAWRRVLTTGYKAPDGSTRKIAEDDLPKVEKYMADEGIANPAVAAYAWSQSQEIAAPRSSRSGRWDLPGSKNAGDFFAKSPLGGPGIMEDEHQWGRDTANFVMDEIRAGRGQRFMEDA